MRRLSLASERTKFSSDLPQISIFFLGAPALVARLVISLSLVVGRMMPSSTSMIHVSRPYTSRMKLFCRLRSWRDSSLTSATATFSPFLCVRILRSFQHCRL